MAKIFSTAFLLSALIVGSVEDASAQDRQEIFREVNIGIGQSIVLGEPLTEHVLPLLAKVRDRYYRVRPGAFAGAQSITVTVTQNGRVESLAFDYPEGTSYSEMLTTYVSTLGEPARTIAKDSLRVTIWEDLRTRFQLLQQNSGVSSNLSDKATKARSK